MTSLPWPRLGLRSLIPLAAALALLAPASAIADPPQTLDELIPRLGEQLDLELDGRVVIVDFWASWCGPCRKSFPFFSELAAVHEKEGLIILTVNLDRNHEAALSFLEAFDWEPRVFFDPEGKLAEAFELEVMPTSFLFGRDGVLRQRHEGFRKDDTGEYEAVVTGLLSEKVEVAAK